MKDLAILYPVFALAAWTGIVLSIIPIMRIRAARRRQVVADDFKYGESKTVPPDVSIPNRNFMNLLEVPVLFYVVCLLVFVTGGATPAELTLAWLYVALRVLHSLVHLGHNHVLQRLAVFASSNAALLALWVLAALNLHAGA